jgi:hypothetical protein
VRPASHSAQHLGPADEKRGIARIAAAPQSLARESVLVHSIVSSVPATDNLEKWKRWIHKDIRHEVVGMYSRRKMWLDMNEILGANPAVGPTP